MANNLQQIIREAFNLAYKKHKENNLYEDAKQRGASLEEKGHNLKAKADAALNQIIANPNAALKYPWDMPKKSGLSMEQMNYIIDSLVELYQSTKDNKYKDAIGNIFIPSPKRETKPNMINKQNETTLEYPQIYWNVLNAARVGSPLEQIYKKNPDFVYEAILKAWGKIFKGGTVVLKKGENAGSRVDAFDSIASRYRSEGQGFAGGIVYYLVNDVRNELRRETKRGETFVAPPKASNGKDTDFGDTLRDSPDSVSATGEEIEDDPMSNVGGSQSLENEPGQDSDNSFNFENYKNAIKAVIDLSKSEGVGNEAALLVFQELMLNYKEYDEITAEYPQIFAKRKPNDLLRDLITKNKKFNEILKRVEDEYGIPSIANALFPAIEKRANTGLQDLSKSHRQDYPAALKSIIKISQSEGVADTKSLLAFEGFFLDGLSFSEIVDENPGQFKSPEDVKSTLDLLVKKNTKFQEIAKEISTQFNLSKNVLDAYKASKEGEGTGAQWISKSGKEMTKQKQEPVQKSAEEESELGYIYEKFLADNLDKIMERVYIRLSKRLDS